jgi:hypothetical protein
MLTYFKSVKNATEFYSVDTSSMLFFCKIHPSPLILKRKKALTHFDGKVKKKAVPVTGCGSP